MRGRIRIPLHRYKIVDTRIKINEDITKTKGKGNDKNCIKIQNPKERTMKTKK
jgi:hypothetical protein